MAEGYLLTSTVDSFLTEQLEGRKRAEQLEEVLRHVLHRVVHPGEVNLLVLDIGKGECLVALRHSRSLVQLRFWRELVDEVLARSDAGVEYVLERILAGALGLDPRGTVLQKAG